ncbi:unnamed protein product [Brassica oleracea]
MVDASVSVSVGSYLILPLTDVTSSLIQYQLRISHSMSICPLTIYRKECRCSFTVEMMRLLRC